MVPTAAGLATSLGSMAAENAYQSAPTVPICPTTDSEPITVQASLWVYSMMSWSRGLWTDPPAVEWSYSSSSHVKWTRMSASRT